MPIPGDAAVLPQPAPPPTTRGRFASPYDGAIVNPPLPYKGGIGHILQPGELMIIQGYIPPNSDSFHVNLHCGSQDSADIALHINPRFGNSAVVRNSRRGNTWEAEMRGGGFPLTQGQAFEMFLLVHAACYKIAFNGKHLAEFVHRMPLESVTTVSIGGNVSIQCLRFQPPANQMIESLSSPVPDYSTADSFIQNLNVPFTCDIPGGLYPGRVIIISGIPLFGASRFGINLIESGDKTVAFHFNPRRDENVVIRNTMIGGCYGHEERQQPYFPFQANISFDLIILCDEKHFKVAVNNRHFITFAHRRLNLQKIDTLEVVDGVKLTRVTVQ